MYILPSFHEIISRSAGGIYTYTFAVQSSTTILGNQNLGIAQKHIDTNAQMVDKYTRIF